MRSRILEPRVAVIYTETVEKRGYSLEKFVGVVSANAARIMGCIRARGRSPSNERGK